MRNALVARLMEIQAAEGLTGSAFAEKLGVHVSYWHLVTHGRRGVGRKLLDAALRAYPELADVYAQSLTISQDDIDDPLPVEAAS